MTNSSAEWVIAFAGSGDTTLANAAALLDDQLLTDDRKIKDFIVPSKITKSQPGLENVVGYLTTNFDGFKTVPLADYVDVLTNARADGHETCLVVIIGDEPPDDVTADLVEAAFEAGIPVKDLAAGLDDLVSSAEDTEQVPDEPQRPAETTGRRRRTTSTPEGVTPAAATSEPSGGTRPKRRGQPRTTPATAEGPPWEPEQGGEDEIGRRVDDAIASETRHTRTDRQASGGDAQALIAAELRALMVTALSGAVAALTGEAAHAQDLTTAYIKDADGQLRKRGRGKPRRGEEVVFLTRREETVAEEKGLISQ
jgi:hypothetical protein